MNNVLEDSLFVSQNKKFDEIYRTMPERKKSRWKCFVTRSMMMNYGH